MKTQRTKMCHVLKEYQRVSFQSDQMFRKNRHFQHIDLLIQ